MTILRVTRREFVAALGSATAWPFVARAQQAAIPVVGFLSSLSSDDLTQILSTFRDSLASAGYIVGQNVVLETRFANGDNARLFALAEELVRLRPAVVVAAAAPAAMAMKRATASIPIVFTTGFDPVASDLVTSMNRPRGNATGMTLVTEPLGQKRLELLLEIVPQARVIGMLVDPSSRDTEADIVDVEAMARAHQKQLNVFRAKSPGECEAAFAVFAQAHTDGLLIGPNQTFVNNSTGITRLAAAQRLPTVYPFRDYLMDGGLLSYGASLTGAYREVAGYVVQILKGARPADLPVRQSSVFELVINLKTAKQLGLTIPSALQARADEVIE
jgi:putative tryptophan/tyrosine transport system substrate-binding protein